MTAINDAINKLEKSLADLETTLKQRKKQSNITVTVNDGLDEIDKFLKNLLERLKALEGTHEVPFDEAFSEDFMRQHTNVNSMDAFLSQGGYGTDQESFQAIPDDEFDEYVKKHSDFDSWYEMRKAAAINYLSEKTGFDLKEANSTKDKAGSS